MIGLFIQKTLQNFTPLSDQEFIDEGNRFLKTDIHSHLLPGIDDGVKTLEESIQMIQGFIRMGYQKLITTPHIKSDAYRNTPEIIQGKLSELKAYLKKENITIGIEAAAEYYVDEWFVALLESGDTLLTFGDNHILIETSFINKPYNLLEVIFELQASGYRPVFAHPERYIYVQENMSFLNKLVERGVLLQLNANSLAGYYGKTAQKVARKIIDNQLVHLVGSDCHGRRHMNALQKAIVQKHYYQLADLNLLNNTL